MKDNLPKWYWSKGLHDAKIESYDVVELDYNYKLKNPKRNYLQINVNSKNAMYDTSVVAIKFYNFKCDNLTDLTNSYWLEDKLNVTNDKFMLNISLTKLNGQFPEIIITFDDAEVIR